MKPITPSSSSYTPAQISRYLATLNFAPDVSSTNLPAPTLENLHKIHILHTVSFPFDTTAIHYTPEHTMDVTPQGAFRHFVVERRGGSYCFGHNVLLFEVLKGLGYLVYSGGAEIEDLDVPLQAMTRCPHMVLFVQIPGDASGSTYVADVGLGVTGLIRPILLSDEKDNIVKGATPSEAHRLRRIPTPDGHKDDAAHQWWRLEYLPPKPRSSSSTPCWESAAIFSEQEYLLPEFERASRLITEGPCQRFWWTIVCIRYFLFDPSTGEEIDHASRILTLAELERLGVGRYTLDADRVKRTVGAESELLKVVKSEGERINVLRETFGILYDTEDEAHIVGKPGALRSSFVPPVFPKKAMPSIPM